MNRVEPVIGDLPQVMAAQARIVDARLLLRGATSIGDVTSLQPAARIRGQLLRTAALLEQSANVGHWLAEEHRRGAVQARRAARLIGLAMRQRPTDDTYSILGRVTAAYAAATGPVELAFRAAYAGTHP